MAAPPGAGGRPPLLPPLPLPPLPPPLPPLLLPFGISTLHHPGCGCPALREPSPRACDAADAALAAGAAALAAGALVRGRPLHALYLLPHHNLTGGMKVLCGHVALLRARGHRVTVAFRSATAARATPPWWPQCGGDGDGDELLLLPGEPLGGALGRLGGPPPDVVVVGMFHQLPEVLAAASPWAPPALYLEQGHEWLFGDPVRARPEHGYAAQDRLFHAAMHLPAGLAAVSPAAAAILRQQFGRCARVPPSRRRRSTLLFHDAGPCAACRLMPRPRSRASLNLLRGSAPLLVPNWIDAAAFRPAPFREARHVLAAFRGGGDGAPCGPCGPDDGAPRVLLVGNPNLPLKGFAEALQALAAAGAALPAGLRVRWLCQAAPGPALAGPLRACAAARVAVELIVAAPQGALPALFAGHAALLFTSRYEAFGLPVLEAMAAGVPVVAAACAGVTAFARHGETALLAAPGDAAGLAAALLALLGDPALAARLAAAGRAEAAAHSPARSVDALEVALYGAAAAGPELHRLRARAWPAVVAAHGLATEAAAAAHAL
jgi:glycosyltransferase involved in cell wall biosynthesis